MGTPGEPTQGAGAVALGIKTIFITAVIKAPKAIIIKAYLV